MSWIQRAKPGDKVALVADLSGYAIRAAQDGISLPSKGTLYTIREFDPVDREYLRFEELVNGPCDDGIEPSFYWKWFRPVEPRKTDISFAHEILRKATKPVKEDA